MMMLLMMVYNLNILMEVVIVMVNLVVLMVYLKVEMKLLRIIVVSVLVGVQV
jgi:hypothetical protein